MAKSRAKEKEEDPKRPTPVRRDGPYVMMLFITFVAIAAGTVFMYLDNEEYASKQPQKDAAPKIQALGDKAGGDTTPPPGGPAPAPPGPTP